MNAKQMRCTIIEIKKQTSTSYTIEEAGKVVGWITKEIGTLYKVQIKTLLVSDDEMVIGFKEAKEKAKELAAYWKE